MNWYLTSDMCEVTNSPFGQCMYSKLELLKKKLNSSYSDCVIIVSHFQTKFSESVFIVCYMCGVCRTQQYCGQEGAAQALSETQHHRRQALPSPP
jgi:hypothetical protein